MTARISLNLGRAGGHRPLLSKLRSRDRRISNANAGSGTATRMPTCFGGVPLPPGEGGAKRRVRGVKSRECRPSSGASRHLLPEGEGLDLPFRLIWTEMVIDRPLQLRTSHPTIR